MKKVLVVLMLFPLFFCCCDDDDAKKNEAKKIEAKKIEAKKIEAKKIEDEKPEDTAWKEKTYKVKIEIDKPAGCYYYYDSSEKRQGYLYREITLAEYNIKPKEETISFVVFEGGKDNDPKFRAKLYIDDKFIAEGEGLFDGDITDVLRFEYNFKTKDVRLSDDQRI